jgi:hypothetical protein
VYVPSRRGQPIRDAHWCGPICLGKGRLYTGPAHDRTLWWSVLTGARACSRLPIDHDGTRPRFWQFVDEWSSMFALRVAAVGHGACSVFVSGGGTHPVGVIDCGSAWHPEVAADGLRRILDLRGSPSLTVVVTHLHTDHYNGLRVLATRAGRRYAFGKVRLVQARLPRHPIVAEYVSRLYALEFTLGEASGIPDIDLADELARFCRHGLDRDPKSAGDTVDLGGHQLDVLWPPAELTRGMSVRIRRAVDAFDGLAAKDEGIRAALDRVREAQLSLADDRGFESGAHQRTKDLAVDDDGEWSDESQWSLDEGDNALTIHGGPGPSNGAPASYAPSLSDEVRSAARAFGEAANYMSLVLASRRRDFVAWGDVPLALARRLAGEYAVSPSDVAGNGVALAPHHGSLGPTPGFGLPFLCIAQNGGSIYAKWARKHQPCSGRCVSSPDVGDIEVRRSAIW